MDRPPTWRARTCRPLDAHRLFAGVMSDAVLYRGKLDHINLQVKASYGNNYTLNLTKESL